MKIKLNKKDQQAVLEKIDSIEDLKLHAVVKGLRGGGPGDPYSQWSQHSQWMVFYRVIEPQVPTDL